MKSHGYKHCHYADSCVKIYPNQLFLLYLISGTHPGLVMQPDSVDGWALCA